MRIQYSIVKTIMLILIIMSTLTYTNCYITEKIDFLDYANKNLIITISKINIKPAKIHKDVMIFFTVEVENKGTCWYEIYYYQFHFVDIQGNTLWSVKSSEPTIRVFPSEKKQRVKFFKSYELENAEFDLKKISNTQNVNVDILYGKAGTELP